MIQRAGSSGVHKNANNPLLRFARGVLCAFKYPRLPDFVCGSLCGGTTWGREKEKGEAHVHKLITFNSDGIGGVGV